MDENRLTQFAVTKRLYDAMPQVKEFVIPTRSKAAVAKYLKAEKLQKNVRLIPYEVEKGFNPSKAFNLAVNNAKYDHIIITSPEVMPRTDVLSQFDEVLGQNVVAQVFDQDPDGVLTTLVNHGYRDQSPAMYFLAMFNRCDIESINGWDEDFMAGYAYEDDDFGARWNRAGIPWVMREDIQAVHQYHPRSETIVGGAGTNFSKYNANNDAGVVRVTNGLVK